MAHKKYSPSNSNRDKKKRVEYFTCIYIDQHSFKKKYILNKPNFG